MSACPHLLDVSRARVARHAQDGVEVTRALGMGRWHQATASKKARVRHQKVNIKSTSGQWSLVPHLRRCAPQRVTTPWFYVTTWLRGCPRRQGNSAWRRTPQRRRRRRPSSVRLAGKRQAGRTRSEGTARETNTQTHTQRVSIKATWRGCGESSDAVRGNRQKGGAQHRRPGAFLLSTAPRVLFRGRHTTRTRASSTVRRSASRLLRASVPRARNPMGVSPAVAARRSSQRNSVFRACCLLPHDRQTHHRARHVYAQASPRIALWVSRGRSAIV
jgi:hypothetical protein